MLEIYSSIGRGSIFVARVATAVEGVPRIGEPLGFQLSDGVCRCSRAAEEEKEESVLRAGRVSRSLPVNRRSLVLEE